MNKEISPEYVELHDDIAEERSCQRLLDFVERVRNSNRTSIVKKELMDIFRYTAKNPLSIASSQEVKWYGAPLTPNHLGANTWFILAEPEDYDNDEFRARVVNINNYGTHFGVLDNFSVQEPETGDKLLTDLHKVNRNYGMATVVSMITNFYANYTLRKSVGEYHPRIKDVPTGKYL
ncbi:hypothetical protein DYH10_00540 [Candidatus Saccharibacteria bacterium CPR2]|nr:hypothetical protein [Candidatus Saccharibacteria bacterium CPR2]